MMKKIELIIVDTSNYSLDDLSSISFDVNENNPKKKKEKIISKFLKDKYIKNYYIDENNKPLSDDIYFNISHSENIVLLAVSDVPVGVDIEHIRPIKDELKKYISSKEEYEYITNDETFFEIWTNKESLLKCSGIGIKSKLDKINALPLNGLRKFQNKTYISKTLKYVDYIISISLLGEENFDVEIKNINI